MKNNFANTLALLFLALAVSGCASIVSDSIYPVSVTSAPEGAAYEIRNRAGKVVHSGVTPGTVSLKAGAGYFKGEQYTITYKKDGYTPQTSTVDSSVDGWYWGNIVFGGLIGLFAVDPVTGAMFKLPENASVSLPEEVAEQQKPSIPQVTSQVQ
jgi:hypothetical protein